VTAVQARRRAVRMLGTLAGVLLVAGVLPWVTGGETAVRLLALPFVLAGLLVLGATLRVRAAGKVALSAPPVERGCDGCACGIADSCAVPERSQASPAAG
jgi:hypothetical protein